MKKRFLAGLMTLCMLLTLLPTALAAETAGGTGWSIQDGKLTVTAAIGEDGVIPDNGYARAPWSEYSDAVTSIVLESGVTSIPVGAFAQLTKATTISLPETLTYIGDAAFERCAFTSITLPASLTELGSWPFNCRYLTELLVASGSQTYKSVDGVLFTKDGTELVCYPQGKTAESYDIPDGVTTIGDSAFTNTGWLTSVDLTGVKTVGNSAFFGCGGLTVQLPDSIESIGYNAFGDMQNTTITVPASATFVGELAFNGPNLTEILVDEANPSYCSVDGVRFTKDGKTLMEYPVSKPDTAYTIPDGTETIADQAFWLLSDYGRMEELTVPASVTGMSGSQTWDEKLTKITFLGDAPADLGELFFRDVAENFTIYYTPGTSGWTDSENYDAAAGTWLGFPLKAVGSEEGGDTGDSGEEVPPAIHKLTAPTDLKWGVYYKDDNGTPVSYPGMIAWTVTDAAYEADYEVYVYKEGETEPVFSNCWIHRAGKSVYKNDHDFVSSLEPLNGQYYFTIQALGDGETTENSDLVTSGVWSYTYPDVKIAPPTGLAWDGTTATWTPNPDENSGGFIVEYWFSADDSAATSVDGLSRKGYIRYFTEGIEDGAFGMPEDLQERWGDGYYYFTISTQSANVENAWHSDRSALSPALTVGNPPVGYKMTAIYDDDLCDFTIYNFEGYNQGNYQIIPNGGILPLVEGKTYGRAVMEITNIADGYRIKDFLINGKSYASMMIDGAYGGGSTNFTQNSTLEVVLEPVPAQLAVIEGVDIYPSGSTVPVESVTFSETLFMISADVLYGDGGEYPDYFTSCDWEYSLNGTVWLEVPSWGTHRNFNASWSCFTDPEWCNPTIDFMTLQNYYLRVRATAKEDYSATADGESVFYSKPLRVNWTTPMLPQDNAREQEVTAQVNLTTGLTAGQTVHLMAALYDEEGRFLSMEQKTVTVNANCEVQEALVMKYGEAYEPSLCKVFILNSDNAPMQVAMEEDLELDGPLTRGEYCALLTEALGITGYTPAEGDAVFSDLAAGDAYYEAIMALVQRGYIVGYSDGTFRPEEKLSCAAAAGMLCRAGLCGEEYVDYGGANWVVTVTKAVSNTGMMNMETYQATSPVYRSDVNFEMVKVIAESMANA